MEPEWDVVVIGGGPAGMIAAGRAAERGKRVLLLEKNSELGKKLLITGGGRCNVTNADPDARSLISKYGDAAKFLHSAFAQYFVDDALNFFHEHDVATKIENDYRVFPVSDSAASVRDALRAYLKDTGVTIRTDAVVTGFDMEDSHIRGVRLQNNPVITASSYILATGGRSRPETGSTGEAFGWLEEIGHTVRLSDAALVPLAIHEDWVKRLQGITLSQVRISVLQDDIRQETRRGKILFTHFGVTGPTILNMSRGIGALLPYGPVTIQLDLFPDTDAPTLDRMLVDLFELHGKRNLRNTLAEIVPTALATVLRELAGISLNSLCHSVRKEHRQNLVWLMKRLPFTVSSLMGLDKAVVTSGGVALEEVDFRSMQSRFHPNLYIIGDVLDINRPTGGYSLQLCWTTGYIAGNNA